MKPAILPIVALLTSCAPDCTSPTHSSDVAVDLFERRYLPHANEEDKLSSLHSMSEMSLKAQSMPQFNPVRPTP